MTGSFEGKVAFVTGAGTGMGTAAAVAFAEGGASVVLVGRRREPLEAVAQTVGGLGREAVVMAADMSNAAEIERTVEATMDRFGRLDAAFNNAGTEGTFAPIVDLTAEQFDETVGVNLRGVWLCCKHEIAAMLRAGNGGAIVNTSSWLAHGAFPGSSIYSASKSALDGMIRALAQEVATDGIRINNVNPGIIDTPMFRRFADDTAAQPFIQHTPARRLGAPDDVGDVVAWLCSEGARFVTGQNLLVDGGYTIPGHRAWVAGDVVPDAAQPETAR